MFVFGFVGNINNIITLNYLFTYFILKFFRVFLFPFPFARFVVRFFFCLFGVFFFHFPFAKFVVRFFFCLFGLSGFFKFFLALIFFRYTSTSTSGYHFSIFEILFTLLIILWGLNIFLIHYFVGCLFWAFVKIMGF